MGEQSGEKTEEPTPHKLREARKKGQVAKSKEITTALVVLISYATFRMFAEKMWLYIVGFSQKVLRLIPQSQDILSLPYAMELVREALLIFFLSTAPIFLVTFVAAILIEGFQSGFAFSSEPMIPKLEKLNPISGIKRMFSVKGLVQILISLAKIIIAIITWSVIRSRMEGILNMMSFHFWGMMLFTASLVFEIAMKVAIFYLLIAIIDYFYQRYAFRKSMMMTKQEVKEEYKRLEGDPTIKQRQRQAQREMAQKRQMGQVPKADVVVTNPIHIAVAVGYDEKIMKAPQVLAKGRRLIAEQIKKIADEHDVPIVENVSLARGLYKTSEAGSSIHPQYYRAVAEVLAFVYRLGRNKNKRHVKPVLDRNTENVKQESPEENPPGPE